MRIKKAIPFRQVVGGMAFLILILIGRINFSTTVFTNHIFCKAAHGKLHLLTLFLHQHNICFSKEDS